jgi:hypothetical protein
MSFNVARRSASRIHDAERRATIWCHTTPLSSPLKSEDPKMVVDFPSVTVGMLKDAENVYVFDAAHSFSRSLCGSGPILKMHKRKSARDMALLIQIDSSNPEELQEIGRMINSIDRPLITQDGGLD